MCHTPHVSHAACVTTRATQFEKKNLPYLPFRKKSFWTASTNFLSQKNFLTPREKGLRMRCVIKKMHFVKSKTCQKNLACQKHFFQKQPVPKTTFLVSKTIFICIKNNFLCFTDNLYWCQ